MPIFNIHAINSTFRSSAPPQEFDKIDDALQAGIRGAVDIASEELRQGSSSTVIEVCIADSENIVVSRSAVALSVCHLLLR